MSATPNMAEVIRKAIDHRLASIHTMLPGVVESYDATKQTASVRIAVQNTITTENGEETIAFPLLTDVPVGHPRAGDWFVHFPIAAGDCVTLHFGERALDQFRLLGADQPVLDFRKHDISDAIAYPVNVYPDAAPLTGLNADTLSIGHISGSTIHIKTDGTVNLGSATPTDAIATANKVNAQLQALATAFAAWVPVPTDGGAVLKGLLTTLAGTGWPADVASTKGKVDP